MSLSINKFELPVGEVDLLVGINCMNLQPENIAFFGNLGLYSSQFGSGYTLRGDHPETHVKHLQGLLETSEGVSKATHLAILPLIV